MTCNPILSSNWVLDCPPSFSNNLYAFYCVGFIWLAFSSLTIGGHLLLKHLRTGELINFSILLGLIEMVGGFVHCAFFLTNIITRGDTQVSDPVSWFWIATPFYINEMCSSFFAAFLYQVSLKKPQRMDAMMLKSGVVASFFFLFIVFPFVLVGDSDLTMTQSFQLFATPLVFTNTSLLLMQIILIKNYRQTVYTSLTRMFSITLVLRTAWLVILIVHLSLFDWSVQHGSAAAFFVLWSAEFIFIGFSGQLSGSIGVKNEVTDSAIDLLKPTLEVEMMGPSCDNAVIKPIDPKKCKKCTVDPIPLTTAQEQLLWEKPPQSLKELFSFPNPINETEARLINFFATFYMTAIFLVDYFAGDATYVYIPSFVGWALRALSGPKLEPHSWFALWLSRHYQLEPVWTAGPPKRANQVIAFTFTITSFILYVNGYREAALWVLAVLYVMVMMYVTYAICATCCMFYIGILVGIFPEAWNTRIKFVSPPKNTVTTTSIKVSETQSVTHSKH